MHQGDTILQLQNVSRLYHQGGETIRALDRVNLTLRQGEFVAIAGPSGSGKTPLLNVSVGLDQPTEGKVWVGGQDLTGMSAPALAQLRLNKVGFIFQSYNLVPVLSAEENAELILLLRGVPAAERKRTVHRVLKEVGLEGLENRRPSQLSGGQQQQLSIARALATDPKILLLDEPTEGIQPNLVQEIEGAIKRLNHEVGRTLVLTEQHIKIAKDLAHEFVIMDRGRIVVRGPIAELTDELIEEHLTI